MEVYAAQIDRMDQGIGRIIAALEETGQIENTLIIFLSDNGACAEDIPEGVTARELVDQLMIAKARTRKGEPVRFGNDPSLMPGGEDTYQSYGTAWANLSNTPFRLYKHWIHEGGIATPFIVHWPRGIKDKGGLRHNPSQLPDIMATILDVTGATYPKEYNGNTHPAAAKAKAWCRHSLPPMAGAGRCSGSTKAMPPSGSANGSWCGNIPGRGSSMTWRPTAPRCTTSPHSIRNGSATCASSTRTGPTAAA